MSRAEWGTLSEPTIPVPEPEEDSDTHRRTLRTDPDEYDDVADDDLPEYDLTVAHNGVDWSAPGGGQPGDDCGTMLPAGVCDECGHVDIVRNLCDRRMCPRCWSRWANRFSVQAAKRVQSYRYTQPDDHRRQWAHVVVSPPDGAVDSIREVFDGRSKAYDIAAEKGLRGGAVVAHAYRATEGGKTVYRNEVERDDDGEPVVGFWVWLRNNSVDLPVAEFIEWSPHYHIIGLTSANMEPGDPESDDWFYHVIRFNSHELNGVANSEESHKEVFGTFRYLSSHIFLPDECQKQSITWHGDLANSVFVENAIEDWQHEKPSEGIRDSIERYLKQITEGDSAETDDSDGLDFADLEDRDNLDRCPADGCDHGRIIPWRFLGEYTISYDHISQDVEDKMNAVFEWRMGTLEPPGGLKHPDCEADVRLALEELC